jgi:hypothetical protein
MDFDGEERPQDSDERAERRWNIPIPVSVKGLQGDGTEFQEETITADASPSGMCLLLSSKPERGNRLIVAAPEENFESPAKVLTVSPLGANMNRVRVTFPKGTKFARNSAAKKYVYNYESGEWVGYIVEDTYYDTKHEPFGKVDENHIISPDSGTVLFHIRAGNVYDKRGNCIGHLI